MPTSPHAQARPSPATYFLAGCLSAGRTLAPSPGTSNMGCRSCAISLAIRAASTAFSATLLAATALRRASAALSGFGEGVT